MSSQRLLSALILLLSFTFSAHANLVTNGDFETNDLTGWTLTPGANPLTGVDNFSPHSGLYAASFGAYQSLDTIAQSLNTSTNETYDLSFWLSNTDTLHSNTFEVLWDGLPLLSWFNADPFSYSHFGYQVTASSTTTTLEFKGFNDDGYYRLDDVSVPEPELAWLLSLGLASLAVLRKRQRII
jgi:hypothetical protein